MKTLTEEQILKPGTIVRIWGEEYVVMGDDRETSEEDLSNLNYYLLTVGKTPEFDAWYDLMTLWTDIEAVLCSCCRQWRLTEEMESVETQEDPEGRSICSTCLPSFKEICPHCGEVMTFDGGEDQWNSCDSCLCHLCEACAIVAKDDRVYCPDCAHE